MSKLIYQTLSTLLANRIPTGGVPAFTLPGRLCLDDKKMADRLENFPSEPTRTLVTSVYETLPCERVMPNAIKTEGGWKPGKVIFPYLIHVIQTQYFPKKNCYAYYGNPSLQVYCRNKPLKSLEDNLFCYPLDIYGSVCTPHEYDGLFSKNLDLLNRRVMGIWYGINCDNSLYRDQYCMQVGRLKTLAQICKTKWQHGKSFAFPVIGNYTLRDHLKVIANYHGFDPFPVESFHE